MTCKIYRLFLAWALSYGNSRGYLSTSPYCDQKRVLFESDCTYIAINILLMWLVPSRISTLIRWLLGEMRNAEAMTEDWTILLLPNRTESQPFLSGMVEWVGKTLNSANSRSWENLAHALHSPQ